MRKSKGKMVTECHPRKVVWILFLCVLILCAFGLLARPPGPCRLHVELGLPDAGIGVGIGYWDWGPNWIPSLLPH